jgi:hypothetical protein
MSSLVYVELVHVEWEPGSLSYDLCVWDPARHAPMPTNAAEANETAERLSGVDDIWNSAALKEFSSALVQRYEAEAAGQQPPQSMEEFWGGDPRISAAECRTAVYRLCLPSEAGMAQLSYAVDAAAGRGLVILDDENGMCFLPDGTIFPEDMREVWAFDLAELKAGPVDPALAVPDSRTLLQKIAGELFDAIGRGEKSR